MISDTRSAASDPSVQQEMASSSVNLERKIDALPLAFRTAFILREVEEMTIEEAAECLAIPAATVRTRVFRARAMLRESLAEEMDMATSGVFAFAGARCDRIVAGVLQRLKATDDTGA